MDTDELNAFKCDGKLPSERVRDAGHDLLEALEEITESYIKIIEHELDGSTIADVFRAKAKKANAAIAKARGQ